MATESLLNVWVNQSKGKPWPTCCRGGENGGGKGKRRKGIVKETYIRQRCCAVDSGCKAVAMGCTGRVPLFLGVAEIHSALLYKHSYRPSNMHTSTTSNKRFPSSSIHGGRRSSCEPVRPSTPRRKSEAAPRQTHRAPDSSPARRTPGAASAPRIRPAAPGRPRTEPCAARSPP